MARGYMDATREWLKASGLDRDENVPLEAERRNAPEARPIVGLCDAVDVVGWYHMFIYVKLMRAISGLFEEDGADAESDANGSAKIALIAIDRSISAWRVIAKEKPSCENGIKPFVACLAGLRRRVEETLPNARAFRRPGFDDPDPARRKGKGRGKSKG
jgi:hypothetical protein